MHAAVIPGSSCLFKIPHIAAARNAEHALLAETPGQSVSAGSGSSGGNVPIAAVYRDPVAVGICAESLPCGHSPAEADLPQTVTAPKETLSVEMGGDARHTARDRDFGQRGAVLEGEIAQDLHPLRDRQRGQRGAGREGIETDLSHAVRDRHAAQLPAILKSTVSDAGDAGFHYHREDPIPEVFPKGSLRAAAPHVTGSGDAQYAAFVQRPAEMLTAQTGSGFRLRLVSDLSNGSIAVCRHRGDAALRLLG